ncbi:enoyl-CoA hydratase/isomerase family protein [Thermomicrobiaceae bacterium CFH 74404]|uniref:Enoyl-CoA hydratase/isomerase family protein n=1 Tax=Thermalbibacter longus TaxID=2951981 RepID=A0AA41WEC9_9BACT|nr:enoyl-CoA hydratase/isomerase family protein [Thermalbibacter longus]MCM8750517.1 enoyl-CoA hydratase/isomerase family protein [Thermalbibacter longus]
MTTSTVLLSRDGAVATLTLNRPEKLNALNVELVTDLRDALTEIAQDKGIRLVVVRGAGRAFCAGLDLDMMAEVGMPPEFYPMQEQAFRLIETMDKLVVAAIHGYCLGGGVQLAIACDFRIVAEGAVLALPAINEGLFPGMAPYRLPRLLGLGLARRYVLLGDPIPLAEAERVGLVDWIVPELDGAGEFERIIEKLLAIPFTAAVHGKHLMRTAFETPFGLAFDDSRYRLALCLQSADVQRASETWRARKVERTHQRSPDGGGRGDGI